MFTTSIIILAAAVLFVLGVILATILVIANKAFHVEVDPLVESLCKVLPGANCGGCGYVGCTDYAEALAEGDVDASLCGPGGSSLTAIISELLGVEVAQKFPFFAVVHCASGYQTRFGKNDYHGTGGCQAMNLVTDVQGCVYGCLGGGDCAAACNYGAISIENGLAVIDYEKCVGCKVCQNVCPRNIISIEPFKNEDMFVIACSNKDFGDAVKAVCELGCLGCTICDKKTDTLLLEMDNNLPIINYNEYSEAEAFREAVEKCPRTMIHCVGITSTLEKKKAAECDVSQADFKTTVDETEWRG